MMNNIKILQTPLFLKKKKRLKKNQIIFLDEAVSKIVKNPEIGTQKKGDLSDVWVYKFKIFSQTALLAYQWNPGQRVLITIAFHENFYRDLKSYLS